ncbi:MAG: response regulator [Nitrospirae bacterium]|nr:response regulator [Nitrospirota bacterium]MBF0592596.1 response regulator [Nitrospirota bacterium]
MDYDDDNEFLKKLLATYIIEAREHVAGISSGLLALEKLSEREQQLPIIEKIYREAHSLKGAAGSVNLEDTVVVCQALESLFAALKRGELSLYPGLFDLLFDASDLINELALNTQPKADQDSGSVDPARLNHINQQLISATNGELLSVKNPVSPETRQAREVITEAIPAPVNQPKGDVQETIRIPLSKLDTLILQTEELISVKIAGKQHVSSIRELKGMLQEWMEQWSRVQPQYREIAQKSGQNTGQSGDAGAANMAAFLQWNYQFFRSVQESLVSLKTLVEDDYHSVTYLADALMQQAMDLIMFPLSSILESFPKVIRDICRQQGKEVDLIIRGADIRIDKRLLQEIKDPLLHIVRNCVDHGMEIPDDRLSRNKPARGRVVIDVAQRDSNKVELTVSDDGAGINVAKVKAAALGQGIISHEEFNGLSDTEAMQLILRSGLSTSAIVTDLSGRGLGLAIVREKVEGLGGTISIESTYGQSTAFSLVLPITLATFRGTIIQLGKDVFAVPTISVERVVSVRRDAITTVKGKEVVEVQRRFLSLVRLANVLGLEAGEDDKDGDSINIIVLASGARHMAFVITAVLGEDEILVKGLGRQLSRVRNIAAATVLGSGKVALILNVSDLLRSAVTGGLGEARPTHIHTPTPPGHQIKHKRQSVLVVEDSITARMLLKNILESAGYNVKTAVDGMEALAALREAVFDLIISDVAMPRLNGFELTERIRMDKRHADVPVVLVTGMESSDDKRRGIEVGANAYIVKSSFDQNNLLEVIKRFTG